MEAITLVNVQDVQTDRIIHHRKTNKPFKMQTPKYKLSFFIKRITYLVFSI